MEKTGICFCQLLKNDFLFFEIMELVSVVKV